MAVRARAQYIWEFSAVTVVYPIKTYIIHNTILTSHVYVLLIIQIYAKEATVSSAGNSEQTVHRFCYVSTMRCKTMCTLVEFVDSLRVDMRSTYILDIEAVM